MQELGDGIVRTLEERGPLVGAELREVLGADGFGLWRECMLSERVVVERVGRRYLRLDRKVEGYARLSPSILREFVTYCVVGLADRPEELTERSTDLAAHISDVCQAKRRLAQRIVGGVGARLLPPGVESEQRYCVLLAGDIVYDMGHDAPRSEKSTGQMVRGSDLDLVVITRDDAPDDLSQALDDGIYREKYRHLNNPAFREEIDYVVKPIERVREQVGFDTFKRMVSCKILGEADLIYGSQEIYDLVMDLLRQRGILEKLGELERSAVDTRARAEARLLEMEDSELGGDELYLFHTSEETEEFE